MKLMGVDVGFSATRPSTGIACLDGDRLSVACARTSWASRCAQIPEGFRPSIIALDGPLISDGVAETAPRACERIFVRAPFDRRCKLALSHWGSGLQLKRAARNARVQFSRTLAGKWAKRLNRDGPIVEAFPNAFLAVLMPEETLIRAPRLARGRRFDWLYDQLVTSGKLEADLSADLELTGEIWNRLKIETHHDKRAALICLLTAAFAAQGTATMVGEATGGWLCLPPWPRWQPWAVDGLERAARAIAAQGYPRLDDWDDRDWKD
ncbi:MAG TPA: hypothetical protein VKS22_04190 [Candidatus Binataceae bacterium]|nr:hypothetical protein [Candidatus Binataceae bacterium]